MVSFSTASDCAFGLAPFAKRLKSPVYTAVSSSFFAVDGLTLLPVDGAGPGDGPGKVRPALANSG